MLDIDPYLGLKRQTESNKMELEDLSFHQRIRDSYRSLASRFPERIVVVNADQTITAIHEQIKSTLGKFWQKC
jgi:dTMP kinase